MRKTLRRLALALVTAGALLTLPLLGCVEESPWYEPQQYPGTQAGGGPGPSGTAAYLSGEASKTAQKPVKEGARVTDAGGGDDAGTTDTVTGEDEESVDETEDSNTDIPFEEDNEA